MKIVKHQFFKKLKKIIGQHFTLIIVPNSCNGKIRNCRLPFVMASVILILITINIYIFFAYSIQIWQIDHFQQKELAQNKMIVRLTLEKAHVIPILNKERHLETQFILYRQENQEMFETWARVRQKGNIRFRLASRGFFNRSKTSPFILTSISKPNTTVTSLDQLDHNLDQLEPILKKEIGEQKQLFQDLKAYEHRLDHFPSLWPVYAKICSPFGMRFHPILRKYMFHEGVDLAVEYGTKVRAAADGVVNFADWEEGYGLMVEINHDFGYATRYGHNSRLLVHQGEAVKKGQVIALSGNTGESTGPHVHYEVRINGKPVNPVPFLKE